MARTLPRLVSSSTARWVALAGVVGWPWRRQQPGFTRAILNRKRWPVVQNPLQALEAQHFGCKENSRASVGVTGHRGSS